MKQIGLLLRAQAAEWKNKKKTVILMGIVLIIGMISTFSYVKMQETGETETFIKLSLGVANEDESEYSKLLIAYFLENETFSSYVDVVQDGEEILKTKLNEGTLDAYLLIPSGFADGLMNMEHLPMKAVVSMRQPTKALVFRQVLEAYETYIKTVEVNCTALYDRMREEGFSKGDLTKANVKISMDLIFTALGKDEFFRILTVEQETEVSLTEHYLLTALYFIGIFLFLPAGLRIFKLRQSRMLLRLKTMRVPAWKVLFATTVPYLFVAAGWMGVLLLLLKRWELWTFLCGMFLLLSVFFAVLFLSTFVKKRKDYLFSFGVLLIVLAVAGGGIVPKQYLPDTFAKLATVFPNERFVLLMTGNLEPVKTTLFAAVAVSVVFLVLGAVCLDRRGEAGKDA